MKQLRTVTGALLSALVFAASANAQTVITSSPSVTNGGSTTNQNLLSPIGVKGSDGNYHPQASDANGNQYHIPIPGTANGPAYVSVISAAASASATNSKSSVGKLCGYQFANSSSGWRYVFFYDVNSAPSVGSSIPKIRIGIPAGGVVSASLPFCVQFNNGIGWSLATSYDYTASFSGMAAGDIVGSFYYN